MSGGGACVVEDGGPGSSVAVARAALSRALSALSSDQAQLQQAARAALAADAGATQLLAARQVAAMQARFAQSVYEARAAVQAAQQACHANAQRLQFDQDATKRALHCLKLESDAWLLDGMVGRREYNRLHPRYALE